MISSIKSQAAEGKLNHKTYVSSVLAILVAYGALSALDAYLEHENEMQGQEVQRMISNLYSDLERQKAEYNRNQQRLRMLYGPY